MNKRLFFIFAFILFFFSRLYILKNPPPYYSDVFHDYRRYAAMWQSGITPYFKHLYEYPPATIPLIYLPEALNQRNIGHYYENYRFQIFILDTIIFFFILKTILSLKTKPVSKYLSLGFYLIGSMVAKDFFYEGIDLVFIGSLVLGLIFFNRRLLFWFFFWLSTSIKLLTAPLAAPYFFMTKLSWVKELKAAFLGFLLVWGLPLIIFRTSLSVMFFFHNQRGLKYASFPSFIVETINYFTKTEVRLNQPPDFQLVGPVSDVITRVVSLIFPLSILIVLGYACFIIFIRKKYHHYLFSLKLALIYVFTIFLSAKIFSQPFHIWFLPLIALLPFRSLKHQLAFMLPALWLLIIDTTPWIRVNEALMIIDPLPLKFFIYSLRFLPMIWLLVLSYKLPNKE